MTASSSSSPAAQPLPTREVRATGVRLSTLGFGGAVIGNLYRAVDDATARAAVDAAWDAGIRYFDTAPHYGVGLSERRLGEALSGRPRDEFVVSSKVGRLLRPRDVPLERDDDGFDVPGDLGRVRDYSRDGVLRSVEETLERTGLDRIDVVYVHDPDSDDELGQTVTEALPALVELRDQGVVGAVGAGMNFSGPLTRVLRETDADVVMLAGRYTLLEQGALDDVLPAAVEQGRAVVAVGVFNSGLLARQQVPDDAHWNYEQAPPHVLARARQLAAACAEHGTTLPAAAVAFALAHPAVVDVTLGMRTPEQVARNAALLGEEPADGWQPLWDDLAGRGLLGRG
ncbi:aldo/keto reductase [Quadrisphaera setariae]|uniref:Aldo/keto reductase n=1 Tax=Quadrisphaera setariae TaxID=2593304 RepID=A0A5C8ZCN0_9ACTN|nr:aldo/keto reductase [Quadrisphaera setariae]TXR55204.1 aldo/keto reductase [Quadrisphaera setariae]